MRIKTSHYKANNYINHLAPFLLFLLLAGTVTSSFAAEPYQDISSQRQSELHNLLIQDCGSCHGMTLKGGLGPALTTEVLKNKPRKMIETTILLGRPGTPMPPWKNILSEVEVRWIVDQLYRGVKQ